MAEARRWLINGRVQGVFFRESTRRQAEPLGLSGHAVNLDDGRVEVIARGEAGAIEKLEAWLHQGPPSARVETVDGEAIEPDRVPESGFQTG